MNCLRLIGFGLATLAMAGCHSIGPGTIPRDRLDYSESLAESWKHQILRNIVKLRYHDTPIFLDVSQIVSGYTLETGVSLNGQFSPQNLRGDTFVGSGVSGTFTDRPTITYTPLTGNKFLRGMIDPVPPRSLFYLIQSGYAADFVLGLGVDSLNGLHNRSFRAGRARVADREFVRVIELLQLIQDSGAVGMKLDSVTNGDPATVLFFRQENLPDPVLAQIREVKQLLKLPEAEHRFRLVYSPLRGGEQELAVGSRSIVQMLTALATFVEVPSTDIEQERAVPAPDTSAWTDVPLRVHCTPAKPEDAFVAVQYRKRWFWIADQDWRSKRTLSTVLFLFTLTEGGVGDHLPMLTIPAG